MAATNNLDKNENPPLFASQKDVLVFLSVPFIALFVYCYTLLPGSGYSGDTCKFHFVGAILGTSHESGEPLYILLTAVFVRLFPGGSIAWRVNFFSALFAGASLCGLYLTQIRLGISRTIAWGFSLCAAFMYTLWSQAVVAEVYTLNAFFVAWIFFLYISWQKTRDRKYFYLGTYFYALSFGDHLTMITFLPALLLFVFLVDRTVFLSRNILSLTILFIVIGASQYAYIIHRFYSAPPGVYVEMAANNVQKLLFYVSGGQFHREMFSLKPVSLLVVDGPSIAKYIARELLFLLPLPLCGLYVKRKDSVVWLLLLSMAGNIFFTLGYMIDDIFVYLIPTYLTATLLSAATWNAFSKKIPQQIQWGISFAFPAIFFLANLHLVDQHAHTDILETTERMLHTADHDAVIYCPDYTYAMALWYQYYCEGWKNKNIQILFSHTPFSPQKPIEKYLQGTSSLPSTVTRTTIPTGLSVFWFSGYNHLYPGHDAFKENDYDRTTAKFHADVQKTEILHFDESGIAARLLWENFYQLTLSGKALPSNSYTIAHR